MKTEFIKTYLLKMIVHIDTKSTILLNKQNSYSLTKIKTQLTSNIQITAQATMSSCCQIMIPSF